MSVRWRPSPLALGFTLIELTIAASIIGILATMGVPMYTNALRTARFTKAVSELRVISQAIDMYRVHNGSHLPVTLSEVGYGGRLDPWGMPYCYLNYELGTGDGLDWAVGAGLVDPSAILDPSGSGSGGSSSGGHIADRIRAIAGHLLPGQVDDLVRSLKGRSLFTGVPVATTRRSDRYLFPLIAAALRLAVAARARRGRWLDAALARQMVGKRTARRLAARQRVLLVRLRLLRCDLGGGLSLGDVLHQLAQLQLEPIE